MSDSKLIQIPNDQQLRSLLLHLEKADRLFGKTSENSLETLYDLEEYYSDEDDAENALKTCKEIIARNNGRISPDDVVTCEFTLHSIYYLFQLKDYKSAETTARNACSLTRQIAGSESHSYFISFRLLVEAMEKNGKVYSAMHSGKRLLRLCKDVCEEGSEEWYKTFLDQARRYVRTNKYIEALHTLGEISYDELPEEMRFNYLALLQISQIGMEDFESALQTANKTLKLIDPKVDDQRYQFVQQNISDAEIAIAEKHVGIANSEKDSSKV